MKDKVKQCRYDRPVVVVLLLAAYAVSYLIGAEWRVSDVVKHMEHAVLFSPPEANTAVSQAQVEPEALAQVEPEAESVQAEPDPIDPVATARTNTNTNTNTNTTITMGSSGSKHTTTSTTISPPISSSQFSSLFRTPITRCDDNSSSPPPPPPPPGGAAPPPPPPSNDANEANDDSIARAAAMASQMINPGPYEQAPGDLKRIVQLDTHDGFRCDINKQLSPYLAVVHSFWLGTNMLPDGRKRTYTWLAQVADESSMCFARIDPSQSSVDGRVHKSLLGGLAVAKLQLGMSAEGQSDQCLLDVDINGMSWSGNLKYGSMGGGPVYGCAFHQGITSRLSMGGEGMYVAANGNMMSNYLLKYSFGSDGNGNGNGADQTAAGDAIAAAAAGPAPPTSTVCLQFAPSGPSPMPLTVNYKKIVTPKRVTLGAELSCDPMSMQSHCVLGGEFKFHRSKLHVAVDGNLKMQSVFETSLGKEPGQPRLSLTAELDHLRDEMKFGYGLAIDG